VDERALAALTGLADPVRRRLYQVVAAADQPVGRDEAAASVDIGRSLAAYHLDRLVADGLLVATYLRRSGRSGPGAGRPAKLYEPALLELAVQVPARDDAFVGGLLAKAVEADRSGGGRRRLNAAASKAGRELTTTVAGEDELVSTLRDRGYAPVVEPDAIRLRNCPFHHLVGEHRDLVCTMNLNLIRAMVRGSGNDEALTAVLNAQPGSCCVSLRRGGERPR
jgi:predicted ArsR family transcriptional regulator